MPEKKRFISVTIFCLYLAAVAFLCFAKPEDIPQLPTSWFGLPADKVGHFLMFAPFPLLAYTVFENSDMSTARKLSILAVILCFGIGMASGTEKIQAALAYREASMDDFIADMTGLAVGGVATIIYIFTKRKK